MRQRMQEPITGYGLAVVLAVAISLTVASMLISLSAIRNSERQFCGIVADERRELERRVETYRITPPTSPTGQALQREAQTSLGSVEQLRRDLECPPEDQE